MSSCTAKAFGLVKLPILQALPFEFQKRRVQIPDGKLCMKNSA